MVIIVKQVGREQLCAALGSRSLRRHAGRGSPHRPSAGDAGRLRRHRVQLQPRDPGAPPAGIGVQADRLCDGARKRHHSGDDRSSMRPSASGRARVSARNASSTSTADTPGPQTHALGRRAVAQPDDRPRRRHRSACRRSSTRRASSASATIGNYLSIALGAGDTTVLRLTNAYAILANQGRSVKPTHDRLCRRIATAR